MPDLECISCQMAGVAHEAPEDNVVYRCPTCGWTWKVVKTVTRIFAKLEGPS